MKNLLIVILLAAVAGLGWMLYQQQLQTQQQITLLTQRLDQVGTDIESMRNRVQKLDKSSINGLVKEANNAILDGWEALVNGVGEEVKRARESIQQSVPELVPRPMPDSAQPQLESPNGLDKT